VGSESSFPAATATWFTAVVNKSLFNDPLLGGTCGRFGYSVKESVGRVNFALAALTKTFVPSKLNVIGLFGRDLEISASSFPGTNTFPFWFISALKTAFVELSKSEPDNVISSETSITIPNNAVVIGLFEMDLETQLTASTKESRSAINFICPPFLFTLFSI